MGEAKQRRAATDRAKEAHKNAGREALKPGLSAETCNLLTKELIRHGLLIDAGFVGLRAMAYEGMGAEQLAELRKAFFAGAQHLFTSIVSTLDPEHEPTAADMKRMECIDAELSAFGETLRIEAEQFIQPEPTRTKQ